MNTEEDWKREEADGPWWANACQCGGDMPGQCPGPAHCPMCQGGDDDAKADCSC